MQETFEPQPPSGEVLVPERQEGTVLLLWTLCAVDSGPVALLPWVPIPFGEITLLSWCLSSHLRRRGLRESPAQGFNL